MATQQGKGTLLFLLVSLMTSLVSPCRKKAQFLTFNADLHYKVPDYLKRRELIPLALLETHADVICLQGIWRIEDVELITNTLQHVYPHSISNLHYNIHGMNSDPSKTLTWKWLMKYFPDLKMEPCKEWKNIPLAYCMIFGCQGREGAELLKCLASTCTQQIAKASPDCITCLVRPSETEEYEHLCGSNYKLIKREKNNKHGLLMLSRLNVVHSHSRTLHSDNAGFLLLEIEGIGSTVCSHLHASDDLPYVEDCGSKDGASGREEENLRGVYNLLDIPKTRHHVIMGDLNTGPKLAWGIDEMFPRSYIELIQNELFIPFVEHIGHCTYCADNPLVQKMGYNKSHILDHVLCKGLPPKSAVRVLEEHNGEPLSAHYGVQVGICLYVL